MAKRKKLEGKNEARRARKSSDCGPFSPQVFSHGFPTLTRIAYQFEMCVTDTCLSELRDNLPLGTGISLFSIFTRTGQEIVYLNSDIGELR